jgi:hypothetical protein
MDAASAHGWFWHIRDIARSQVDFRFRGKSGRGVIMGKRAVIYVRVSTDEQTVANQEDALRATAARMGH